MKRGQVSPLPSPSQALLYAPVVTSVAKGDMERAITRRAPSLMAWSNDSATVGVEYRKPSYTRKPLPELFFERGSLGLHEFRQG